MQSTRETILNILKKRGQATVDELGQELGLTAVTVRHHLDVLRGEGLVAAPNARHRKTPGRPQYAYALTEEASAFFPKKYEQLTSLILDEMHACLSPEELDQIMKRIGRRIADQADLPSGGDFSSTLTATVEFLNRMGYMACSERNDGSYLLHVANCPYERVAQNGQEPCTMDLAMLTRLLGVEPERTAWSAKGDPQCTYEIHPPTD